MKFTNNTEPDWPHAFAAIYKKAPVLALALMEINELCHCQRNDVAFIAVQGGVWVIYEDGLLRWISNSRYE